MKPLYADWVEMGKEGFRAAAVGRISILQPPGEYSVVLAAGGEEYRRSFRVLKDPHSEGTEEDIRLQTEMMEELRKDLNETASSINRIEWVRKQLQDLRSVVNELGATDSAAIVSGAEELEGTLVALEEKLYELKVTDRGQDRVRWPVMLAGRIAYLANAVSVADFRPADQHREVHQVLRERLRTYQQELDSLFENEIPAFNRTLRERDLPTVLTGGRMMKIERPKEDEYAPFYAGYVARVPEEDILEALSAQPKELSRIAESVTPAKERFRYGDEKWSVREIVGHLVDAERFFGHRAFCVSRGDATPLPGFDENLYVSRSGHDSRPLADLVKDFSLLREANVRLLESLDEAAWPREGVANGAKVTVRALAYVMTGHVRHHVAVLKERYGIG